jgi:spermidine synthase
MMQKTVTEALSVRPASGTLLPALMLLFFLSGVSGLIYEVLWLRLLGLVFGVTIYAASTVFASFMGGLALGSFLAGRLVDRARNPLFWYGAAEALIGIAGLATPAALGMLQWIYPKLYADLPRGLALVTLIRFLFSFLVLLAPTTLMGATLPIIIKSSLVKAPGLGKRASLLYASNTAGAIAGTLTAGFYLIGVLGVTESIRLAAALNLLVGISAIGLSIKRGGWLNDSGPGVDSRDLSRGRDDGLSAEDVLERTRKLVLAVFAISGAVSLALEVIWFRMLVLILEETSYAFTIMLAAFLSGIAAGSYIVAPLARRRLGRVAVLAFIEIAIGVASLLSVRALNWSYDVAEWARPVLSHIAREDISLTIVASVLAIFPVALLLGVAFPIGLRLWVADGAPQSGGTGRQIGIFYSLNVAGGILGSLIAGFVLLPKLGSRGSLIAVSFITLIMGLLLLADSYRVWRSIKVVAALAVILISVKIVRRTPTPMNVALKHRYPYERLLWAEEGLQTTVAVNERSDGKRIIYLDGLVQGDDSTPSAAFHRQLALLPLLLQRDPKVALEIGLGSGTSGGMLGRYPGIQVDLIELSPSVLRGVEWFRNVSYDVLHQENVHLRIDDGRNFLLLSTKQYDVITGVPIRPFTAGGGNLFSAEFFEMQYRALKDDGVVVQWIRPRRGNDAEYKLIMRTFLTVFPNATLWDNGKLLIGTKGPLMLDRAEIEAKMQRPEIRDDLKLTGLDTFQSLLSFYTAGPDEMKRFAGDGPILTDDRPMAEYFLSLPEGTGQLDLEELTSDVMQHVNQ